MHSAIRRVVPGLVALLLCGCGSQTEPEPRSAEVPPQPASVAVPPPAGSAPAEIASPDLKTNFTQIVSGAGDSVGAVRGSVGAQFAYRFRQIDPGSDRFTFQDRDLSFYFRPTPNALHFQVENRTNKPVTIDWDRSRWVGVNGSDKLAHASTRWNDRFGSQSITQILGLQRYSDYAFPMNYLIDPGSSGQQLHRVLFPEDQSAVQYADQVFGFDMTFRIEDRIVPYSVRFKIASVVPR